MSNNPKRSVVASLTRTQAMRFMTAHENDMLAEIHDSAEQLTDDQFRKLFSIEKKEVDARFKAFIRALTDLTMHTPHDMQAIRGGLDIMQGIMRISNHADAVAVDYAQTAVVEEEYRKNNEFLPETELSARDENRVWAESKQRTQVAGAIAKDNAKWEAAAQKLLTIAAGVGIDTKTYAQRMKLGSTPD